ncbi:LCP family protein [Umezawaea sp. Da 62-37]|uniref:LCP family protein n=1 Tax=Umezawaea sp. Da 62-37 TaxID=3075927 RepID=UPI0028F713EE|nr:LCP family protein [Umezawaea sp. Da 62-37]WNV90628.1 LCP family protein [Umezawaea sp. Da 62-37]
MVVTWYGWSFLRNLDQGTTTTDVISSEVSENAGVGRKPLDGAVDILMVGIDSRVDAQGNPLAPEVLDLLSGGVADGEMNTDTMILVHIPVDGTRARAFSFPRDSYVEIADGFGKHKLNSAFARQKNTIAEEMAAKGEADQAKINLESTAAGRKTLIKTIENLTGGSITIDRYAEVNLASFYEVTKAIGGVEVCVNQATSDYKSGANFAAGPQTIDGATALSFVRQREGLPNGDLDRIARQQVFIGALAKKVLSTGMLTDVDKLDDLVTAVQKSVVLSQGWDITTFAEQMQGLVSGNIEFRTIPVGETMDTYNDGNVIQVDPAKVKAFVRNLASDETSSPSTSNTPVKPNGQITVQVLNASGTPMLAATVLDVLVGKGYQRGEASTADVVQDSTVVHYAPGDKAVADKVAKEFGGATVQEDESVAGNQIAVYVGADYDPQEDRSDPAGTSGTPVPGSPTTTTPPAITAGGLVCVN